MRILFAASEALPYWKTGGLADVAEALPNTLTDRGHEVRVIMPLYRSIRERGLSLELESEQWVAWPGGDVRIRFFVHTPASGTPAVFVEHDGYFGVAHPYGSAGEHPFDTGRRYAFFSRAVAAYARAWAPDVVHLNDWQTGLVPVYGLLDGLDAATVFAIHNLAYQGNFDTAILDDIGIPRALARTENGLEFNGGVSFMKGGLALSDRLVTVSPTYAREIGTPEFGAGFEGLLRFRRRVLNGVLNGIDQVAWNPATDPALPAHFDARKPAGKDACRTALLQELGLSDGGPLLTLVTRLAYQKGLDFLLEALPQILDRGGRLAVVGNGDPEYEAALKNAAAQHPDRVAVTLGFNDPLARRLYAGGDFFLMPSRYEPCGLGQLFAQRYGTLPIVRRTGGLADTVTDAKTGFAFDGASANDLLGAVQRAFTAWRGPQWDHLRRRCMRLDWSWSRSAAEYEDIYRVATGRFGRVADPEN